MTTRLRAVRLLSLLLLPLATFFSPCTKAATDFYAGAFAHPPIPPPTLIRANQLQLNDTFAFTGAVTVQNQNGALHVGPGAYANIAAAVTAAGSNNTLIVIDSTYAGSDCPAAASNKIFFFDYRGGQLCTQNVQSYFTTSGSGLFSFQRPITQVATVNNGGSVGFFVQHQVNNGIASGGTAFADAFSPELDFIGTLTGTVANAQVSENAGLVISTGGAITHFTSLISYVNQTSGNTALTNVDSGTFLGCNIMTGSVPPVNCRAAFFDRQTAGSGTNFAIEAHGMNLVTYDSNAGAMGVAFKGVDTVTRNVLFGDSFSNTILQAQNAAGLILNDSTGGAQVTAKSTGLTIAKILPLPNNTAALTADWTCGTGGTVSSCVAATIIGSGGGVPLTFTLPLIAQSYTLECDGVVGQATAATANQWNLLTATNGATNVTASYSMATAATASAFGAVTDQASTTTTFQIAPSWTLGGTATKMPFHIYAKIEGASVSGTVVSLQLVAPTVGDLVTIYRGSACRIF